MYRLTKLVIILLFVTFFMVPTLLGNLNAGNNANSEIKSPISTHDLKVKSFRRDTAFGIELAVNGWLRSHPGIHIYFIQSHSTTLGTKILYIWYK